MSKKSELDDLLGELGATEPLSEEILKKKVKEKKEKKSDGTVTVPKRARKPKPMQLAPSESLAKVDQDANVAEVFNDQFRTVLSQYGDIFTEIIQNYKSDREQAQEVIDAFMDVVAAGGNIPRVYVEKIADAIRAKTEIAQTALKALDAVPKLISASKNSDVLVQNNVNNFDSSNLAELLSRPEYDDEKIMDGRANVLDVEKPEKAD